MKIQKVIVEFDALEYSEISEYLKKIKKITKIEEKSENLKEKEQQQKIQLLNWQVSAVLNKERVVLGVFNSYVDASEFINAHRQINYSKKVPLYYVCYHTDNLNESDFGAVQVLTPADT